MKTLKNLQIEWVELVVGFYQILVAMVQKITQFWHMSSRFLPFIADQNILLLSSSHKHVRNIFHARDRKSKNGSEKVQSTISWEFLIVI